MKKISFFLSKKQLKIIKLITLLLENIYDPYTAFSIEDIATIYQCKKSYKYDIKKELLNNHIINIYKGDYSRFKLNEDLFDNKEYLITIPVDSNSIYNKNYYNDFFTENNLEEQHLKKLLFKDYIRLSVTREGLLFKHTPRLIFFIKFFPKFNCPIPKLLFSEITSWSLDAPNKNRIWNTYQKYGLVINYKKKFIIPKKITVEDNYSTIFFKPLKLDNLPCTI